MHIADRFVVVLDANVLFPFRKRDVLLRFELPPEIRTLT